MSEDNKTILEQEKTLEENEKDALNRKHGWIKELLSWVITFAVAYILALIITHFVIIKTEIISGSMISTLNIDDRVVGNRLAYLFDEPQRGDVIFFAFPDNESKTYVKRVIGLPGETVTIEEGTVYIDGEPLDEPYLNEPMDEDEYFTYVVPEDGYFVMGDNRNISVDSRYWNQKHVTPDEIYAKAWFRYRPTLDTIKSATYD